MGRLGQAGWLGALVVLTLWLLPAPTQAQERRALVIGNDRYDSLPDLQKARNDARAVTATLERLGFAVVLLEDADRRAMTRAVADLAGAIQPGDEVLVYFAGHGVEVAGRNLLLPADAPAVRPGDEAFLVAESVALDALMDTLAPRRPRVKLVILDACRDNPFPREGMRSAGGTRGLAPVLPPEGSFIMFSAGAGQAALDALGPGDLHPNSVFTRALLPLLEAPGLPVQEMARVLRGQVEETARSINHRQRPAYYDELTADFVLNAGIGRGAAPLIGGGPAAPAAPDPCAAAARDWQVIAPLADAALMRSFAETHADCALFSRAAAARADEIDPPAPAVTPPVNIARPLNLAPAPNLAPVMEKGAPPVLEKGGPPLAGPDLIQRLFVGLQADIAEGTLWLDSDGRSVVITLAGAALFQTGSDALRNEMRPVLARVAGLLQELDGHIRITGHTDDVPLSGRGRHADNHALSLARSAAVAEVMALYLADPMRIETLGAGPDQPIADNATPEGRARNRRIEISIPHG